MQHTESTHQPPSSKRYDFSRFGRHKLRAPNGAIIDLPVPVAVGAQVWVATVWPDPNVPGGWARQVWRLDPATGRGWRLPHQLAAGDIVEFGADTPTDIVRWYGIMDSYEVDRWATVQGPYADPAAAWNEAQRLVALERYIEPLSSDEHAPSETSEPSQPRPVGCTRPRHHRRHPESRPF